MDDMNQAPSTPMTNPMGQPAEAPTPAPDPMAAPAEQPAMDPMAAPEMPADPMGGTQDTGAEAPSGGGLMSKIMGMFKK